MQAHFLPFYKLYYAVKYNAFDYDFSRKLSITIPNHAYGRFTFPFK